MSYFVCYQTTDWGDWGWPIQNFLILYPTDWRPPTKSPHHRHDPSGTRSFTPYSQRIPDLWTYTYFLDSGLDIPEDQLLWTNRFWPPLDRSPTPVSSHSLTWSLPKRTQFFWRLPFSYRYLYRLIEHFHEVFSSSHPITVGPNCWLESDHVQFILERTKGVRKERDSGSGSCSLCRLPLTLSSTRSFYLQLMWRRVHHSVTTPARHRHWNSLQSS